MTRPEAIRALIGAWFLADPDTELNEADRELSWGRLLVILNTLGVTDEEALQAQRDHVN